MKKLCSSNLSFIIQGSINNIETVNKCIASIRKFFPKSIVILSTWENSNYKSMDFDKLVLSHDTNSNFNLYHNSNLINNINRQIISSYNGLKASETLYSIKLRTDMIFFTDELLHHLKKISLINNKKFILKNNILLPYDLSINPQKTKLLFHFNDWILCGKTSDLKKIFNLPLMNKKDFTYFKDNKNIKIYNFKNWFNDRIHYLTCKKYLIPKFIPEQFIFKYIALKNTNLQFTNAFHFNDRLLSLHLEFLKNCIYPISLDQLGVKNAKHIFNIFSDRTIFYTKSQIYNYYFDLTYLFFKIMGLIKVIFILLFEQRYISIRKFYYDKLSR